ncbi:MAG: glycoside hydrolase family 172 protein [Verrucomicrobiota bacterium]|nr:glycoside hydrolase family 172 protein [Verrucomicrobiota bacterium]
MNHPSLGTLSRLSNAKTRSISAENVTGEKGRGGMSTDGISANCARDLGQGWKVSPCVCLKARSAFSLANIEGPGIIQHMWMTCAPNLWRSLILRITWDNESNASVEVPLGDFFCCGWCERGNINSIPVAVLSAGGMNSYWEMPFRKAAHIEIVNIGNQDVGQFFFQITYSLTDIPDDCAYFHAQWRRSNPVKYKDVHTILDGVKGQGHYVGTYLAWQTNSNGWWGEGEMKFFMDGDKEFPTICGTGTEDYFGGAWAFEAPDAQSYQAYTSHYLGFHQVIKPNGFFKSQQRFGMYRWHLPDPIRFMEDLRVTVQALGWRSEGRYLPLQDDIASVAYWYQTEPHVPFGPSATRDELEVI